MAAAHTTHKSNPEVRCLSYTLLYTYKKKRIMLTRGVNVREFRENRFTRNSGVSPSTDRYVFGRIRGYVCLNDKGARGLYQQLSVYFSLLPDNNNTLVRQRTTTVLCRTWEITRLRTTTNNTKNKNSFYSNKTFRWTTFFFITLARREIMFWTFGSRIKCENQTPTKRQTLCSHVVIGRFSFKPNGIIKTKYFEQTT